MTDTLSRPLGGPPEGPMPPQALDAERAVLAAMLLDEESVGRAVEMIQPDVFYRVAHQKIFEGIVSLYNRNEKIDLITLSEELRKLGELEAIGGPAALTEILEYAATSANLEQHIRIIHSKSILRLLIKASTEIQQECFSAADETPEILDRAEARIFQITDQRVRQGFMSMKDLMMPTMKHIEELSERDMYVTGIPSGYSDLDKYTAGFQKSDLIIIAGRPGMGKTSFALNVAENAAIHHESNVAVLSLEMSKEQLALRLLCSQSEVPLYKLRSGRLNEAEWRRLINLTGALYKAPIMIDDTPSPTLLEIRAKCRRLKSENRLDMVVIDYLQLMRGSGHVENRVQEISQITRGLKGLAKELDVPILALSQLSRASEQRGSDRRPQLSDLRESGCLTADTRILRADTGAETTMGELFESGERNIPVWSLDENLCLSPQVMTHVFSSGTKRIYEMKLASGRSVKASANHPFLTLDGWRSVDALSAGERLATPRAVGEPRRSIEWVNEKIVMLAHLIGDGCFVKSQPIHYTSADPANLAAVEDAAAAFGITPRRVPQKTWWHVYLPAPYRLTHGKRNPIAKWLDELGLFGLRSHQKFIPAEVFSLPIDQIALFIRHLWATDGCVHLGKDNQSRIYYASTSQRLIEGVRLLLLRFGISARVKATQKGHHRPGYQLHLYGANNQRLFLNEIGVHGARGTIGRRVEERLRGVTANTNVDTVPREVWGSVKTSMRAHGVTHRALSAGLGTAYCGSTLFKHAPSRERLSAVAGVLEDAELEKLAQSDVFWDTIVSIEPCGEEEVFDATVPGTHNFVANGIVAHNSIEQDADVVMFVFREEVYKRDDPELKGRADLLLAKQRNGPTGDIKMTFLHEFTKFVPYSPIMPGETEPDF